MRYPKKEEEATSFRRDRDGRFRGECDTRKRQRLLGGSEMGVLEESAVPQKGGKGNVSLIDLDEFFFG